MKNTYLWRGAETCRSGEHRHVLRHDPACIAVFFYDASHWQRRVQRDTNMGSRPVNVLFSRQTTDLEKGILHHALFLLSA